ncbi:hypothetical protein HJC23_009823 [Cyclotella cryptica]|uniref:WW domain-containing protein n=1 Tax=Cyclotella cryptica TaxID=29204 RepID=A0ABD3PJ51_9STRA|eukprot:CCRYP_014248-RA/>CCRYP_014248-RA protein AED:0.06 eAED:0.06 QI:768/1/1/1/1/1/7/127/968
MADTKNKNKHDGKRKRDQREDVNRKDDGVGGSKDNKQQQQQQQQQQQGTAQPLPDKFQSHREYCALWAPLLLNEMRAQLLSDSISDIPHWRNKPDQRPVRVMLQPRKKDLESTSDGLGIVVKEVVGEYKDRMFMANDIVVLVEEESILWDATKGTMNGRNNSQKQQTQSSISEAFQCGIVGHIEYTRRSIEGLVITVSRSLWTQIGSREMTLLKIGSNITSLREFTALCRMDRLPLAEYILCNKMNVSQTNDNKDISTSTSATVDNDKYNNLDPSLKEKQAKKRILESMGGASALGKGFADYARHKFNLSQLEAVSASAAEYGNGGFTLIKGPPGTGKTTTLCALLNALHIRQMNQYFGEVKVLAESYNAVVGKRATLSLSDAAKKRPRILVCAPSNAAVDNIILKIMEDGFVDGNGMRYNPSIVRIGSGQSASVKDVCLEDKVESYLSESLDVTKLENTIEGLKGECRRIHSDITKLRQRMNVMKNAAPYPLSKDWEIRIDEETADCAPRVYFVNHKDKTTTYEVPPPPEPGERHFPARAMPEYKAFVSRVVKMVERYNNITSKIDRYSLCRNAAATAAASGGSSGAHSHAINNVRIQLETYILDSVHIVMTTLGTAGNRALEAANKFEVVVIDEAAQSVEPSTLAGLQLGSSHAILVGDPQQLPATIFSMSGRDTKYDRSLFARLEEAGHAVHMLDTQYRMHPAISDFPRRIFYDGRLVDGPNVKHPEYGNPLKMSVFKKFPAFQPFTVLDLESSEERGGTSLANSAEAQLALHVFNNLKSGTNGLSTKSRVAVITPYAQQAALLRRTFSSSLGGDYERFVEVNTVDAFQGREANIVIFSCVRAAGSKGIGFLSDVRRMNVALTRAKNFLFVIARCSSIMVNPYWRDLVEHARETDAIIPVPFSGSRQSTFSFPDLSTLKAVPARGKRLINEKERLTGVENGETKQSVIELMGLKLEIPPTKRPNR